MSSADSAITGAMQGMAAESGKSFDADGGGDSKEDQGINELFKVNQIHYKMLPTLSLVAKRTFLVNNAQKSSYTGTNDTITFNFNTGEFYVSPVTSWWYVQAGFNNPASYGTAKALLSHGNFMSMCDEISFTTASGTEVCREINAGLYRATVYRYKNTQEYINTLGQIQGASYGPYHMLHDGVAPVPSTINGDAKANPENLFPNLQGTEGVVPPFSGSAAISQYGYGAHNLNVHSYNVDQTTGVPTPAVGSPALKDFCIPLDQVLGVFKPYMSTLFPAGALSGGRLDIRLKNPTESLQFIDGLTESNTLPTDAKAQLGSVYLAALISQPKDTFQIARTYLVLDSFQLQDNVLKRLNQLAGGRNGLNIIYDTYDYVVTPFQQTGSIECQVQQARSRIIRSFCVVRDSALTQNPYVDSLASEGIVRRVCGKIAGVQKPSVTYVATDFKDLKNGFGGGITPGIYGSQGTSTVGTLASAISTGILYPLSVQPPLFTGTDTSMVETDQIVTSYQAVLGALYFPQQPFTTTAEFYANALFMFGKGTPNPDTTCAVTYEDFLGGLGTNLLGQGTGVNYYAVGSYVNPTQSTAWFNWVAPYGCAVFGFLAEKSQALNLSGLPISNARLLRHKLTFAYPSASGSRTIATFTEFTRVMKVFLGGRVVVRE
jgi:hypothetical protein